MNLASKLGEDIAEQGEILVTQAAWDEVSVKTAFRTEEATYSISGLQLTLRRVLC